MNKLKTKIQQSWEQNPVETVLAGTAVVAVVTKLIDAVSAAQGRRAYAKQVNHRVKKNKK